MPDRWSKNGGPAASLPFRDQDAAGQVWSNLADNPAGRVACGWAPAGVPEEVTLAQARAALLRSGQLAAVDAWVQTQDQETQIFWTSTPFVRRTAPKLLAGAAALGWSDALLDELFFQAAAIDP
jgi:hypothetical protein